MVKSIKIDISHIVCAAAIVFLCTVSVWSQSGVSQQYLLIALHAADNPDAFYLELVDTNGSQRDFSSIPIDGRQSYISPDGTAVSARGTDGNLLVFDTQGVVIFEHNFLLDDQQAWTSWYVWGWADDRKLVLSSTNSGQLMFYHADVHDGQNRLQPVDYLNTSSVIQQMQNIDHIEQAYQSPIGFIVRFTSDFEMLLTPAFLAPDDGSQFSVDDMLVWDLRNDSRDPGAVIGQALPWWYQVTSSAPAWSRDDSSLLFAGFADGDSDENAELALYRYDDSDQPPEIIARINCPDDLCDPNQISWSPDSESVAYWMSSFPRTGDSASSWLVSLDLAAGDERILLETSQWGTPLFWSPDSDYIAFQEAVSTEKIISQAVRLVNVKTGETDRITETQQAMRIVGWLSVAR